MSCSVCSSAHSRQPLLCPTCARNHLYPLRLENAQILLEKERLGQEIAAAVAHESTPQTQSTPKQVHSSQNQSSPAWALQVLSSRQASSSARKDDLQRQVDILKDEIKAKRIDILERQALLSRRRSDAESAQYELAEREASVLTNIQNTTKRTEHLWHTLHSKTAEARIFLCREAAHLYGLRQRTSKRSDGRHSYVLGGLGIIDLKDLNGMPGPASVHVRNVANPLNRRKSRANIYLALERCPPVGPRLSLPFIETARGNHLASPKSSYCDHLYSCCIVQFPKSLSRVRRFLYCPKQSRGIENRTSSSHPPTPATALYRHTPPTSSQRRPWHLCTVCGRCFTPCLGRGLVVQDTRYQLELRLLGGYL